MWLTTSFVVMIEVIMASVIFTVTSAVEERPSLSSRVRGAVLWPTTLWSWGSRLTDNVGHIVRLGMNVWLLVTLVWLIGFEHDKLHATSWFLAVAWMTLSFVAYSVDGMDNDLRKKPYLRALRAVFWFIPLKDYLCDPIDSRARAASRNVWFLVTLGWLIGFQYDKLHATIWFLTVAWFSLFFVVYWVDGMDSGLYGKPRQRILRAVFWFKPVKDYLCHSDAIRTMIASLLVWVPLTLCWLLAAIWQHCGPSLRELLA